MRLQGETVHFAFTDEQDELRRTVRALVDRSGGPHVPPPESPVSAYDTDLWQRLAGQIGAAGLAVPERYGGSGFTLVEANIVAEELGRRLVVTPFLGGAVVSAEALLASGDSEACARLLPRLATGESTVAFAWAESQHWWDLARCSTVATSCGAGWRIDGEKCFVLDGGHADALLVVGRTSRGLSLFELDTAAVRESVDESPAMDPTRRLAIARLTDAPARLVGEEGGAGPVLARCLDVAAVALAAESVGASQRWLEEILEYVKVREQFGRPIGSFQAIKHRLADLFVAVESARSLSYAASWAVANDSPRATEWAAMAKSYCCETYSDVAAEGIQLHGGIGITWEHEAHLHLKRAHSGSQLFGTPRRHRQRLEDVLALAPG